MAAVEWAFVNMTKLSLLLEDGRRFVMIPGMRFHGPVTGFASPDGVELHSELGPDGASIVLRNKGHYSIRISVAEDKAIVPVGKGFIAVDSMTIDFGEGRTVRIGKAAGNATLGLQIYAGQGIGTCVGGMVDTLRSAWETMTAPGIGQPVEAVTNSRAAYLSSISVDQFIRSLDRSITLDALIKTLYSTFRTDLCRARAAYGWIVRNVAYDVVGLRSGNIRPMTAQDVFLKRSGVCMHYACLYSHLLDRMHIENQTIPGVVKDARDVLPIERSADRGHAWSGIRIDGQWRIVDSTWGAGSVEGNSFKRYESDYWFDVPPALAISSHFPDEPSHQFLKNPTTFESWRQSGPVNFEGWYRLGMPKAFLIEAARSGRGISSPMAMPDSFEIEMECPIFAVVSPMEELRFSCKPETFSVHLRDESSGSLSFRPAGTIQKLRRGTYSVWIREHDSVSPQFEYWKVSDFVVA